MLRCCSVFSMEQKKCRECNLEQFEVNSGNIEHSLQKRGTESLQNKSKDTSCFSVILVIN